MNEDRMHLAELVAYQEGSVVSRQIVKGEGGSVTLFAFAEGEGVSEHSAPFDALAVVLDGEAGITVNRGETQVVHAGEAVLMPATQPHALAALRRFKMMLVMIRP